MSVKHEHLIQKFHKETTRAHEVDDENKLLKLEKDTLSKEIQSLTVQNRGLIAEKEVVCRLKQNLEEKILNQEDDIKRLKK